MEDATSGRVEDEVEGGSEGEEGEEVESFARLTWDVGPGGFGSRG